MRAGIKGEPRVGPNTLYKDLITPSVQQVTSILGVAPTLLYIPKSFSGNIRNLAASGPDPVPQVGVTQNDNYGKLLSGSGLHGIRGVTNGNDGWHVTDNTIVPGTDPFIIGCLFDCRSFPPNNQCTPFALIDTSTGAKYMMFRIVNSASAGQLSFIMRDGVNIKNVLVTGHGTTFYGTGKSKTLLMIGGYDGTSYFMGCSSRLEGGFGNPVASFSAMGAWSGISATGAFRVHFTNYTPGINSHDYTVGWAMYAKGAALSGKFSTAENIKRMLGRLGGM